MRIRDIPRGIIWLYQKTLSADHSWWGKKLFPYGYCKYTPSCSEYMRQAIDKYGSFKGIWLGVKRVGRCTPWHQGGVDWP